MIKAKKFYHNLKKTYLKQSYVFRESQRWKHRGHRGWSLPSFQGVNYSYVLNWWRSTDRWFFFPHVLNWTAIRPASSDRTTWSWCTLSAQTLTGSLYHGPESFQVSSMLKNFTLSQSIQPLSVPLNLNKMLHWPRTGGRFGEVNPEGIKFYNELIDSLLLKGVNRL